MSVNDTTLPPGPVQMTPEQIEAERARGKIAGLFAFASALVLLSTIVVRLASLTPSHKLDKAEELVFISQHSTAWIANAGLLAAGTILSGPVLLYLLRAARARRPDLTSAVSVLAIAGPALYGIASVVLAVMQLDTANEFVDSATRTVTHANELLDSSTLGAGEGLLRGGAIALGLALVLASILSMRVGLLTRFVGIIGALLGILTGLFMGLPAPLFAFWLGSVGLMIAGAPDRRPPAWEAGRAIALPGRAGRPIGDPESVEEPIDVTAKDDASGDTHRQ
jgi:hypothetical protein